MSRRKKKAQSSVLGKGTDLQVKADVTTKDFSEDATSNSMVHIGYSSAPVARQMLHQYSSSPWLKAVVDRISSAASMAEWKVYKKDTFSKFGKNYAQVKKSIDQLNLRPEENHAALQFWNRGNKKMSGIVVRELMFKYIDLSGECYIILDFDKKTNLPMYYSVIPPSWMVYDGKGYIVTYPGSSSGPQRIPEDRVVHIAKPDPLDPYNKVSSIAAACAGEIATDAEAASYARDFFHNGMLPSAILSIPGATRTQLEQMKADFENEHRGVGKRHKIKMIGSEIKYAQTEQHFAPDNVINIREFERDAILQIFGVPPETLGIMDGTNKAATQRSEEIFARMVIEPRLKMLQAEIQDKVISKYFGEGVYLDFYSPMPADKELKAQRMKEAPYAYTINEMRALTGDNPFSEAEGGMDRGAILDVRGQLDGDILNNAGPESLAAKMISSGNVKAIDEIVSCIDFDVNVYPALPGTASQHALRKAVAAVKMSIVKTRVDGGETKSFVSRARKSLSSVPMPDDVASEARQKCLSDIKSKRYQGHIAAAGHLNVSLRKSSECTHDMSDVSVKSLAESGCACVSHPVGSDGDSEALLVGKSVTSAMKLIKQDFVSLCNDYVEFILNEVTSD